MKFELRSKTDNEVVDVLEMNDIGLKSVQSTFGSNTIIIEEDFVLSNEVCKSLGLKQGYTVKTGKYLLKEVSKGQYRG